MIKVLFICTFNQCRSPAAEAIFNQLVKNAGLHDHFFIDSAGTNASREPISIDPRVQKAAEERGLEAASISSRRLEQHDLEDFDLIVSVDHGNHEIVCSMAVDEEQKKKALLLPSFRKSSSADIHDPYSHLSGMDGMFAELESLLENLLEYIGSRYELRY